MTDQRLLVLEKKITEEFNNWLDEIERNCLTIAPAITGSNVTVKIVCKEGSPNDTFVMNMMKKIREFFVTLGQLLGIQLIARTRSECKMGMMCTYAL